MFLITAHHIYDQTAQKKRGVFITHDLALLPSGHVLCISPPGSVCSVTGGGAVVLCKINALSLPSDSCGC